MAKPPPLTNDVFSCMCGKEGGGCMSVCMCVHILTHTRTQFVRWSVCCLRFLSVPVDQVRGRLMCLQNSSYISSCLFVRLCVCVCVCVFVSVLIFVFLCLCPCVFVKVNVPLYKFFFVPVCQVVCVCVCVFVSVLIFVFLCLCPYDG